VRFEVAHTGSGVESDQLALVFDPFQSGGDRGTWLGLAISKTIVEQVGGTIEADAVPGRGTLFRVRLPASR
jgi:signal transduction histidine kinase